MVRRILLSALAVMALASCDDLKVKYDINAKQRATMDLLVGDYELTKVEWDGGNIDIDGDGEALEFSEEYMNANNEEPEVNIDRSGDDNELKIDMLMPVCAVALHGSRLDSYFVKNTVYGYITIENDGSYKIGRLKEMLYGSGGYYETEFDRVFIEFSGETEMKLSATTIFPDYITTTQVTGRITMYFKCVSGKGKKK